MGRPSSIPLGFQAPFFHGSFRLLPIPCMTRCFLPTNPLPLISSHPSMDCRWAMRCDRFSDESSELVCWLRLCWGVGSEVTGLTPRVPPSLTRSASSVFAQGGGTLGLGTRDTSTSAIHERRWMSYFFQQRSRCSAGFLPIHRLVGWGFGGDRVEGNSCASWMSELSYVLARSGTTCSLSRQPATTPSTTTAQLNLAALQFTSIQSDINHPSPTCPTRQSEFNNILSARRNPTLVQSLCKPFRRTHAAPHCRAHPPPHPYPQLINPQPNRASSI